MKLTHIFEMIAKRHLGLRVKIVDWKQSSLALSRVREECHKSITSHANFICRDHLCLRLIQLLGNENRFVYSSLPLHLWSAFIYGTCKTLDCSTFSSFDRWHASMIALTQSSIVCSDGLYTWKTSGLENLCLSSL